MGFRLVKRVFRGDKCVGYYMNGNGKTAPVGIDIVNKYAINKMIDNIGVKNVNGSIVLYGVNGFRIEDLPVERLKSGEPQADLKLLEIHKLDGKIVSYKVASNTSDLKATVKPELMQNYINAGRVNKESLNTAKVIERTTENLLSIYSKYKDSIYNLVRDYVVIIDALETGDKSEKDRIVKKIREIEAIASQNEMAKDKFVDILEQCKSVLTKGIADKSNIYKRNATNNISVSLNRLMNDIKKLDRDNLTLVIEDVNILQKQINDLRSVQDLESYRIKYNDINKYLISIINKVVEMINKQEKERQELDKKFSIIKQEIKRIPENDELREQKIKIMYEPWCLSNKTFLVSKQYLDNCYLTNKYDSTNKPVLSLMHLDIKETFNSKNQRTGFDVVYGDRKYHYRQVLNNMSLLAAFIKVAEDENLLKDNYVNIKVKSRGESRSIRLGVS